MAASKTWRAIDARQVARAAQPKRANSELGLVAAIVLVVMFYLLFAM